MGRPLESWRLFWLLALATSIAISLGLPRANFHSAHGMELIIQHSVRCVLPWFLVAFSASSLAALWPNPSTRWLLANRRYFGLAFAFGMAWHLSFVGYSIASFGNQLNATVTALDLVGLAFLLALTLTSFRPIARRLSGADWRRLHKAGVYTIWLLATYIYLNSIRYQRDLLHCTVLAALLAAWGLRVVTWMRKRLAPAGGAGRAVAMRND
jgi:methionine sulfoxide reductase heme-binding subunit